MEEKTRNAGQGLGVAALVLGVISFIVALIPCIGLFALFTALVAIVLGAIGLSQAARNNSPKGLVLGGLILGIVALFIAIAQIVFFAGFADKVPYFEEKLEDVFKDFERDVLDELEDGSFSITIEDGDDKIHINSTIKKELRDALDELEDMEDDLEEDIEEDLESVKKVDITIKIDTSGSEEK
jgi:hypothetical protein